MVLVHVFTRASAFEYCLRFGCSFIWLSRSLRFPCYIMSGTELYYKYRIDVLVIRFRYMLKFLGTKAAFKAPTSRRAGWWLQAELEGLNEEQQAFVERLCELCPSAARAGELARWFQEVVKERHPEQLGDWLDAADQTELESFARSLRKDYKAVRAALSYEWSNGQVERQIHRLKLVKRQMYGRANFDLLKQRVLAAA